MTAAPWRSELAAPEQDAVRDLVAVASAADGIDPVGEQVLRELAGQRTHHILFTDPRDPNRAVGYLNLSPGRDGADLAAQLRERGIVVRHFKNPARISPFLRITIGTDEQCAGLVDALREIVYTNLNK